MYKRKIISVIVWILISALFVYLVAEEARYLGYIVKSKYEMYCTNNTNKLDESKVNYSDFNDYETLIIPKMKEEEKDIGTKIGEAFVDAYTYNVNNVENEFKKTFNTIAKLFVAYTLGSMVCFYFFISKSKEQE